MASEDIPGGIKYITVAASQTDFVLGTGASGDVMSVINIIPTTTSPGAVSIKDGAGAAITVFTGGAASVQGLIPFQLFLDITSTSGAWKVTTGTNVSCVIAGRFK